MPDGFAGDPAATHKKSSVTLQMLQKTYSIYSEDLNDVQLFIEAGMRHIACWCKKRADNILRAFEFFQYNDLSSLDFEELIDNARLRSRLLAMPVTGTIFFWNTDEALCIPNGKNEAAFLQQNFELLRGSLPSSALFSAQAGPCTVAWRIEADKQEIAAKCFTGATFTHNFTALLALLKHTEETRIYLFFYPRYFTICLFREGRLNYLNTVEYTTPEDVLYFVLNVCRQYAVADTVAIQCGGFINNASKLYETLYQYLEGFQLMQVDETLFAGDEFKEYPGHYFVPYINYIV
ncbi:DUF3822 family protein [Parafilimonas sp.]|uniref:DUF3822 family protein n=1 Tax=Parafilimonas sp. TaxID=1969739 RepID=UPI0039E2F589